MEYHRNGPALIWSLASLGIIANKVTIIKKIDNEKNVSPW